MKKADARSKIAVNSCTSLQIANGAPQPPRASVFRHETESSSRGWLQVLVDHLLIVSDGFQLTLRRNDGISPLHGSDTVRDVVPNFVCMASRIKAKQFHNAHKLKVNRIAVGVLVMI